MLLEKAPAGLLARRHHQSPATVRRHLRQAFRKLIAEPFAPTVPDGSLALLIDGLWSVLRGRSWVLYNMAVKPASANTAWFLSPCLRAGHESIRGWQEALATIPRGIAGRVVALIADGIPGIDNLLQDRGWLLQLCHRHLLASLENKLKYRRRRVLQQPGRGIHAAVLESLTTADDERVTALCQEIVRLSHHPNCTVRLRYTAQYFLRHQQQYRTYLLHPALHLPNTTCALESMHNLLRQAVSTVNDPDSLLLRAQTYFRLRPTITCNGHIFQQK